MEVAYEKLQSKSNWYLKMNKLEGIQNDDSIFIFENM